MRLTPLGKAKKAADAAGRRMRLTPLKEDAVECRQVIEHLQDFVDSSLDRALREQLLEHLSSCDACKAQAKSYQALLERMEKLPLEDAPSGSLDKIMARVRAHQAPAPWYLRAFAFKRAPAFALGLAGLLLMVYGVGMFSGQEPRVAGRAIGVTLLVHAGELSINDGPAAVADKKGVALRDRDHLVASDNFMGQLIWEDGTKVRVDPDSELVVHAHRLELKVGKVWVQVKKRQGQQFSVETPMAVAAVKGTKFDVIHVPGVGSLVKVYKGLVAVTDTDGCGKTVDVEPYRYARVTMDATMKVGDFSDDGSVVNDLKPFYRFDD